MIRIAILLLLVSIHTLGQPANRGKQEGKVIGIIDGDTFDFLADGKTIRVRMNAIDAPEKKQDYYTQSKQALAACCFGRQAIIIEYGHDRYRRLIADLFVNNENINYRMVADGMAWHFKKYSSDQVLASIEVIARKNKKGLWSSAYPLAPWDYRASRRHLKH